jgi:hydrogenase expression/formation protein HypC
MCVTIPSVLLEYIDDERHYAWVEEAGVKRKVNTSLLRGEDAAEPGDYVLVHIGRAISRVSKEEAEETIRFMQMLDGGSFDDFEVPAFEVPTAPKVEVS